MPNSAYGPTVEGAWAILGAVLGVFTILAFIARKYIPIPAFLRPALVPQMASDVFSKVRAGGAKGWSEATARAISKILYTRRFAPRRRTASPTLTISSFPPVVPLTLQP